jgi:hypothetical protein
MSTPIPLDLSRFDVCAVQAIEAGRFSHWWADMWMSNGFGEAYSVGRRWLEDLGRRLEDALRGERSTREDRLLALMKRLSRQARRGGPHAAAAEFFLVHVLDGMHSRAVQEREASLPTDLAFMTAVAVIRQVRDGARNRGVDLDLADFDLQAVADVVADILRGENISATDVLVAIRKHTTTIPLAEWLEDPPTKH